MTATSSASAPPAAKNVFRLHGVNVLNRKNVDSISRLTALEKRRATHILDERQRRDTMNQLLAELANLVRESATENQQHQEQQQFQQQGENGEKKPAVKSNSITTLRSAITEIRRLRTVAGLETSTPPCAASLQVPAASPSSANSSRASSPVSVTSSSSPAPQSHQTLPSLVPLVAHHQLQSPPLSPSSPASHKYSSVSPPLRSVHHSSQASQLPSLFASHSPVSYTPYSPAPAQQYYGHPQQPQYQQQQQQQYHHHHHQQQQQPYYHHQTQSQYEPLPSMSCPSSPAFSTTSTGSSAPTMLLPQPYMQHPPMYQ